MLRSILVFCVFVSIGFCSYSVGPHQPKPEKFKDEAGCYVSELDEIIPFGQARSSKNECMEYFCTAKFISYTTCAVVEALPPCKIIEDKDKPYPECCPLDDCPDSTPPTNG